MKIFLIILKATGLVVGGFIGLFLFYAGYSWLAEELLVQHNWTVGMWSLGISLVFFIIVVSIGLHSKSRRKKK